MSEEPLIAVFVDFENLALGVRDMKGGRFKIDLILKRLLEKGRIVVKRAYCDWSNYRDDVRDFHTHGIELIDIPRSKASGKNSADIHMVVDALDLCYSKTHIDFFALLTGDSDFSPLVSKLKENDKRVLGCGVKQSTSNLLISGCDEFIYYDDLVRVQEKGGSSRQRKKAAKSPAARGRNAPPAAKAGKKAPSPAQSGQSTVEVAGALVDSRSVDKLAGEVAGQSLAITAQAAATKDQTTAIHEHTEAVRDNTRAMLSLEKEIEEHRRELGRRR